MKYLQLSLFIVYIYFFRTTIAVSDRKHFDHSKQFLRSYELNEDLHKCYIKVRDDPRLVHMNRLMKLWDDIHVELTHYTTKKLRDQASQIVKHIDNIKIQHFEQKEIISESTENNETDVDNVNNNISNPLPKE